MSIPRFAALSLAMAVASVAACYADATTPSPAEAAPPPASSSAPPMASSCRATFGGNVTDAVTADPGCATIAKSTGSDAGAGDYVLSVSATAAHPSSLGGTIDLGSSPTAGATSSETVATWSVTASRDGHASCTYAAGTSAIPTGSFALTLDTVDVDAGVVHGTLDVVTYVHAAVATDCGAGDVETVRIVF